MILYNDAHAIRNLCKAHDLDPDAVAAELASGRLPPDVQMITLELSFHCWLKTRKAAVNMATSPDADGVISAIVAVTTYGRELGMFMLRGGGL